MRELFYYTWYTQSWWRSRAFTLWAPYCGCSPHEAAALVLQEPGWIKPFAARPAWQNMQAISCSLEQLLHECCHPIWFEACYQLIVHASFIPCRIMSWSFAEPGCWLLFAPDSSHGPMECAGIWLAKRRRKGFLDCRHSGFSWGAVQGRSAIKVGLAQSALASGCRWPGEAQASHQVWIYPRSAGPALEATFRASHFIAWW